MHFGRLFDFATASSTGALIVLAIACGVVLLGVWIYERELKRREQQRIADEALKASIEANTRRVFNAVNRFRGRMS